MKLTHANLNTPIDVVSELVYAFYKGPDGATFVMANGGAMVPVKETVSEVKEKLNKEKKKK